MFALAQASESKKKSEKRYHKSSSDTGNDPVPGAVPVSGPRSAVSGGGGRYTTNNTHNHTTKSTKRNSRGVDIDHTDTPEEQKAKAKALRGKILGGEDYDSTDAPPKNYRARRLAQQRAHDYGYADDTSYSYCNDVDDITPGATNVPGVGRASNASQSQQQQQNNTPDIIPINAGQDGECITAHLVEEGTVDPTERDQIRREAQEELINYAAKAEIAEPTDNRKWYICACVATLVVIGVVVGVVVATRPEPAPVSNNSFCEESATIEIGSSVMGSTRDSSTVDASTCVFEDFTNKTKGRWFTFAGNGDTVTASTCLNTDFDTRISVFAGGSCSQNELQCIDGNEDNPSSCCAAGIIDCQQRSAITWSTQNGLQYYVYVHGANPNEVGNFQLSLLVTEITSETGNTVCGRAVRIATDSSVSGSNEGAVMPDLPEPCDAVSSNGPGVWYITQGTDGAMAASTCDSPTGTLDDTQISVYSGSCDSLKCVKSNDDKCGTKSEVSWPSVEGHSYYIFVHSKNEDTRGTFDLKVSTIEESDVNAQCLDENVSLNGDGLLEHIQFVSSTIADRINIYDVCRENFAGVIVCTFDILTGQDDYIATTCWSRGGRYILQDFSLTCEIVTDDDVVDSFPGTLAFTNFPACVSFICEDELIEETLAASTRAIEQAYEGSLGWTCEIDETSFQDG